MFQFIVRLEEILGIWLSNLSKITGYPVTKLVRSFMKEALQCPSLMDFPEIFLTESLPLSEFDRELMGRLILTEKLLEYLVLKGLPEGEKVREDAVGKAEKICQEYGLGASYAKTVRLTLLLPADLTRSFEEEAKKRELPVVQLIRNVIQHHYLKGVKGKGTQTANLMQPEAMRRSILTHTLLQEYVVTAYDKGLKVKQVAYDKARPLLQKFHQQVEDLDTL